VKPTATQKLADGQDTLSRMLKSEFGTVAVESSLHVTLDIEEAPLLVVA